MNLNIVIADAVNAGSLLDPVVETILTFRTTVRMKRMKPHCRPPTSSRDRDAPLTDPPPPSTSPTPNTSGPLQISVPQTTVARTPIPRPTVPLTAAPRPPVRRRPTARTQSHQVRPPLTRPSRTQSTRERRASRTHRRTRSHRRHSGRHRRRRSSRSHTPARRSSQGQYSQRDSRDRGSRRHSRSTRQRQSTPRDRRDSRPAHRSRRSQDSRRSRSHSTHTDPLTIPPHQPPHGPIRSVLTPHPGNFPQSQPTPPDSIRRDVHQHQQVALVWHPSWRPSFLTPLAVPRPLHRVVPYFLAALRLPNVTIFCHKSKKRALPSTCFNFDVTVTPNPFHCFHGYHSSPRTFSYLSGSNVNSAPIPCPTRFALKLHFGPPWKPIHSRHLWALSLS